MKRNMLQVNLKKMVKEKEKVRTNIMAVKRSKTHLSIHHLQQANSDKFIKISIVCVFSKKINIKSKFV